jgi:hypothetical protein
MIDVATADARVRCHAHEQSVVRSAASSSIPTMPPGPALLPRPPPLSRDRDALASLLSIMPIDEHITCAAVCQAWHAASCDPTAWRFWTRRVEIRSLAELQDVPPRFRPFVRRLKIAMMDVRHRAVSYEAESERISQLLTQFSGVNELTVRDGLALQRFFDLQSALDRPLKRLRITDLSQFDQSMVQLLEHPRLRTLEYLSLVREQLVLQGKVEMAQLLPESSLPPTLRSLEMLPCSLPAESLSFFLPCTLLRSVSLAFPSGSNLVGPLLEHLASLERLEEVSLAAGKSIAPEQLEELCRSNRSGLEWQAAYVHERAIIRVELIRPLPDVQPKQRLLRMTECHPGDPVFLSSIAPLFPRPHQVEVRHTIPSNEVAAFWSGLASIGAASVEIAEINTYGGIWLDEQGIEALKECRQLRRLMLNGGTCGNALASILGQLPHLTSFQSQANALPLRPTIVPLLTASKSLEVVSFYRGQWVLEEIRAAERLTCLEMKTAKPEMSVWYEGKLVTEPNSKPNGHAGASKKACCSVQ